MKQEQAWYKKTHIWRKISSFYHNKIVMHDYYSDLRYRVDRYQNQFPNSPQKTAVHLIWWNYKSLFKHHIHREIQSAKRLIRDDSVSFANIDPMKVNVGILFQGGIGDLIINANYLYKLRQKYSSPLISFYAFVNRSYDAASVLFDTGLADGLFLVSHDDLYDSRKRFQQFDLFLEISRIPKYTYVNKRKLNLLAPELFNYYVEIDRYRFRQPRHYEEWPRFDGQLDMDSSICGVKRIQQPDIGGILGLIEEYEYPLAIGLDENRVLKRFALSNIHFIAVLSGSDPVQAGAHSNKIWPSYYYEILLEKLKAAHPDYLIVQIGADGTVSTPFHSVDVNLLNATTLRETMVILKHAALFISNEGGMVHLRHALHGGKSLVFFGPTDEKTFGYSENINMRGPGCELPCEWLYADWQSRCVNQNRYACMWSLTPNMVFRRLEEDFFHV